LTEKGKFRIPFIPHSLRNRGHQIISLGRFVQWLGKRVEAKGVDNYAGFTGVEPLWEGERLAGIRTGDKGLDRNGAKKTTFVPGVDILAKAVILGEGVRGSLTKLVIERLRLDAGCNPATYALGIKEVWELPVPSTSQGEVIHTLGFPFSSHEYGGGFVYHHGGMLSLGLVVSLDYPDPRRDPHQDFQRFKAHPFIASMLKGARLAHYGAKAIPEGGYYATPKLYFNGGLIIGDAAALLNTQRLKGIHLAMKSGMLAAETLFESLLKDDFSESSLSLIDARYRQSWAHQELYRARNFRQGFDHGLLTGILQCALQSVTRGRGWKARLISRPCHKSLNSVYKVRKSSHVPFHCDGILTFDKATDLYYSGTKHEENQPPHLLIASPDICISRCSQEFGNPCQLFCLAEVFEMTGNEPGQQRILKINASNCLHCKACDILDPYQIITWVPPEGGGGPNYVNL
jgi:electron-transferring-flavoprotein dehydrogenase